MVIKKRNEVVPEFLCAVSLSACRVIYTFSHYRNVLQENKGPLRLRGKRQEYEETSAGNVESRISFSLFG